jgi:outer membrane immunogenic protein
MKHVLGFAAALVAGTALVGAANAADLPPRSAPITKAPVYVAPQFSWAGFYLGANVGYGWSDGSGNIFPGGAPIRGDGDGFFGGFQGGYNWQMGSFVFGVETDFQLSAGDGNTRFVGGPVFGKVENDWFGTIRGRLGYAVDRWLFYVTGGGAFVHNKLSPVAPFAFGSTSETGWTWTVGAGVEAALWQNWSIKAEYLYLDTPDKVPVPPGTRVNGSTDTNLIRVGVNYHF